MLSLPPTTPPILRAQPDTPDVQTAPFPRDIQAWIAKKRQSGCRCRLLATAQLIVWLALRQPRRWCWRPIICVAAVMPCRRWAASSGWLPGMRSRVFSPFRWRSGLSLTMALICRRVRRCVSWPGARWTLSRLTPSPAITMRRMSALIVSIKRAASTWYLPMPIACLAPTGWNSCLCPLIRPMRRWRSPGVPAISHRAPPLRAHAVLSFAERASATGGPAIGAWRKSL